MKQKIIFLFILIPFVVFSQITPKLYFNDLELNHLKGKVKSFKTETFDIVEDKEIINYSPLTPNLYRYYLNRFGKIYKFENYSIKDKFEKILSETVISFDEKNRIKQEVTTKNGKIFVDRNYKYEGDSLVIISEKVEGYQRKEIPYLLRSNIEYSKEKIHIIVNSNYYIYDRKKRPIYNKDVYYSRIDKPPRVSITTTIYNNKCRKGKEINIDTYKAINTFDRRCNILKTHHSNSKIPGPGIDFRFEYKFDNKGNWTEMKEFRNGIYQRITKRQFTYYE